MREKGAQYKPILAGLHYWYIGRAKGLWRMRRHGPVRPTVQYTDSKSLPCFTWPDNDTDSNNVLYGIETGKCTVNGGPIRKSCPIKWESNRNKHTGYSYTNLQSTRTVIKKKKLTDYSSFLSLTAVENVFDRSNFNKPLHIIIIIMFA